MGMFIWYNSDNDYILEWGRMDINESVHMGNAVTVAPCE